jgi:hypothetical protein
MSRESAKTILGSIVALGVVAHLLLSHAPLTKETAYVYGGLLLFAGVLIDPADFKQLAFWRKSADGDQ